MPKDTQPINSNNSTDKPWWEEELVERMTHYFKIGEIIEFVSKVESETLERSAAIARDMASGFPITDHNNDYTDACEDIASSIINSIKK